VPKRLPEAGFVYRYDLKAGLTDWKRTSRVLDFD